KSETIIQGSPPPALMSVLGYINHSCSQLDTLVSAALYSLMPVDPIEFGVIVGRLETQAKVGKMLKILQHRRDTQRVKTLIGVRKELEKLRPLRNAITHGYYLGDTASDEYLWTLTADHVIDDTNESANELFAAEAKDFADHGHRILRLFNLIVQNFDGAKMHELLNLPTRTRLVGPAVPPPGKDRKTP
ncbi:MAG TPA: hypothetical protein VKA61_05185, partial [Sphingomicrobium sp.]|nr:hypothetical protein [Sphingomicrobium sp.]